MSDFKSKMPDLKELGDIAGKLFKDVKTSVSEIVCNYKKKRAHAEKTADEAKTAAHKKSASKSAEEDKK